ncbi:GtrA family protein [Longispora sp. K20-0274]|uniref:GtrA family protein n=1 Tax=Longispora sp. K20-0274 TaxID=3088255 RepID=UPI00399B1E3E
MSTELTSSRPRNFVLRLYDRFAGLVRELGKFGVVGGITYLVDSGTYLTLLALGWNTYVAKVVAVAIAATLAFVGNRFWTWRDRPKSGLHREYLLYFLFNAIGLGIALGCLWLSHSGLGSVWPTVFQSTTADFIAGNGFGLVLGTLFRFYAYRKWVFVAAQPDGNSAG